MATATDCREPVGPVADGSALATPRPPAPSPWIERWSKLVLPGSRVLDAACGAGRHSLWFAVRGCRVVAVDRDTAALADIEAMALRDGLAIDCVVADLETAPWPFAGQTFDAVVVTNYLWRPLLPTLVASVADTGLLLYETFADGQAAYGRPSNPAFLLRPGELLQAAAGLRVVAYEHGLLTAPDRLVQRIAAVRDPAVQGLNAPEAARHAAL